MKKIVSYKLRHDDQEILKVSLSKYDHFEVVQKNEKEGLFSINRDEVAAFFIHVDESIEIKFLETLIKKFSPIPFNIILKYKDFDTLMLCYKNQVSSVFEAKLSTNSVDRSLVKVDLLSKERAEHVPVTDIVNLFSAPVKIKNNSEFYNRMTSYFNSFESVEHISLLEIETEKVSWTGLKIDKSFETKIKKYNIERRFIGTELTFQNEKQFFVATPVFVSDDSKVWLVISLKEEEKDFVLNDLFYKYIENILIYRMNKAKEQNLEVLATTDEITGLFNQRKLSQDLEDAIILHEKQHETFSIMFIDIDHFKSVNDNYGHVIGSKLLQDIGEVLSLILRASDHIYRYGGDEFVVIMPTVDIKTVHEIANRVLIKIKNKEFDIGNGEKYKLSVSVGIAEYPTDAKSALDIIRFADEMMYMSKRSGRGKVFHVNEVENVDVGS